MGRSRKAYIAIIKQRNLLGEMVKKYFMVLLTILVIAIVAIINYIPNSMVVGGIHYTSDQKEIVSNATIIEGNNSASSVYSENGSTKPGPGQFSPVVNITYVSTNETPNYPKMILLVTGNHSPSTGVDPKLSAKVGKVNSTYVFIMLTKPLNKSMSDRLSNVGVKLFDSYEYNTYTAKIPLDNLDEIANLPFVYWIGYLPLNSKLLNFARNLSCDYGGLFIYVYETNTKFTKILEEYGVKISGYDEWDNSYHANATPEIVLKILELDFVSGVEKWYPSTIFGEAVGECTK